MSKKYDVGFVGMPSEKRQAIIDSARKRGVTVLTVSGGRFGVDRDAQLASAKVLLNVHFNSEYNVYENIRCDRWAFAGQIVVSECSVDSENSDARHLIRFYEYDRLVDALVDTLKNFDAECANQRAMLESHLSRVVNDRRRIALDSFQMCLDNAK